MTWLQRYRIRHYVANSIWILPVASMVAALVAVPLAHGIEEAMGWEAALDPDAARTVVGTLAASMFTFIVFVSSAQFFVEAEDRALAETSDIQGVGGKCFCAPTGEQLWEVSSP